MPSVSPTNVSSPLFYALEFILKHNLPHQSIAVNTIMAPQKPAVNDKAPNAKKAPATEKNNNKIAKRPERGYHKFRNGLLNVKLKGGERELWVHHGCTL